MLLPLFAALAAGGVRAESEALKEALEQYHYWIRIGSRRQIVSYAEKALVLAERELGTDSPETLPLLEQMVGLYGYTGRRAEADAVDRRILAIRYEMYGPDHPETANTLEQEAMMEFNQAPFGKECRLPAPLTEPDDFGSITLVGDLHCARAAELFNRAYAIRLKVLGRGHPDYSLSLKTLAILHRWSRFEYTALALYELAINLRQVGPDPNYAEIAYLLTMVGLGHSYSLGQIEASIPYLQRAIEAQEKAFGPDHLQVAESLGSLASTYYMLNRSEEAEPLYRRIVAIREKAYGPVDPELAGDLSSLSRIHARRGEYDEAIRLLERALDIETRAFGPEDSSVKNKRRDLSELREDAKDGEGAR